MLQTLELLYERLPEEMRAARWMVRERDTFVARTNERVREMVARARQKVEEMVSETRIIDEATEQANILVRRAEDQAHQVRLEAEGLRRGPPGAAGGPAGEGAGAGPGDAQRAPPDQGARPLDAQFLGLCSGARRRARIFFAFWDEGIGFVVGLRYYVCADTQTPPPDSGKSGGSLSESCRVGRRRPNRGGLPRRRDPVLVEEAGEGPGVSRGRALDFSRSRMAGGILEWRGVI